MIQGSETKFLKDLFVQDVDLSSNTSKKKVVPTVGSTFKTSLGSLMETLGATSPNYVRCVKPNTLKKPGFFDTDMVLAQLRYAGMMETIRIRRLGYPIRFPHLEFYLRFKVLAPKVKRTDPSANCKEILNILKLPMEEVQVGLTKVFFRESLIAQLEKKRNVVLGKSAIIVQAWWKGVLYKHKFLRTKEAAGIIKNAYLSYKLRQKFIKMRRAAYTLQPWIRGKLVYKKYHKVIMKKVAETKERIRREEEEKKKSRGKEKTRRSKKKRRRRKKEITSTKRCRKEGKRKT